MTITPRGPIRDDALQGKRILITGGGTGLGKEMARSFIAHGAAVHSCGRRETVLQDATAELRTAAQHGGRGGGRPVLAPDLRSCPRCPRLGRSRARLGEHEHGLCGHV